MWQGCHPPDAPIPDAVWRACRLKGAAESAAVTHGDGAVVRRIVPAAILAEPGRAILLPAIFGVDGA